MFTSIDDRPNYRKNDLEYLDDSAFGLDGEHGFTEYHANIGQNSQTKINLQKCRNDAEYKRIMLLKINLTLV